MAQFDLHANPAATSQHRIQFLLEVQSDLLDRLSTTVVVPLYDPGAVNVPPIRHLMPVFEVNGQSVVMVTPELAGVSRKSLPAAIGDLRGRGDAIMAALNMLLTGV